MRRNYTDEQLERLSGMKRLDIDPTKVEFSWIIDFCCQALRNIIIGIDGVNGKSDGFMMKSNFGIAVSSEIMAILAIAKDLKDMRERMGKIVVAYDKKGKPVTTEDLEVAGAMTAWMVDALNPNLMQTLEGQPVIVHAGPFANIAIGQSSIIADRVGLKLADYHVTESGFGADIGFEKFWNLKCRFSGLKPDCAVVVATIRALKCHGGAPVPVPGKPMPEEYSGENVGWVAKGCANLIHHIETVKKAGIYSGCLHQRLLHRHRRGNRQEFASSAKPTVPVLLCPVTGSMAATALSNLPRPLSMPAKTKPISNSSMNSICRSKRESNSSPRKFTVLTVLTTLQMPTEANARIQADPELCKMGICMVKTHLSLSDNPALKGVPKGWTLSIREILTYEGAGFIVPVAGTISLMPGTGSNPAFKRVDVDVETGKVEGVF